MIEEGERFGYEIAGLAFPKLENATSIVRDGFPSSGDLIYGLAKVGIEADVAVEGEGGRGYRSGRVAWKLFSLE